MTTTSETAATAHTIRQQIGLGALMSLGARDFRHGNVAAIRGAKPLPSLIFNATILPMTKNGKRSTAPRAMQVIVSHNPADYYDIRVTYNQRGDKYGCEPAVVHYEADDVDAFTLPRVLLALDYDGDTILNPGYA